ncbi:phospholipase D family protein [Pseudomonas segetis]|nr:phospholipase D family protein [Pseudomonas segetis]
MSPNPRRRVSLMSLSLCASLLAGCGALPSLEGRSLSSALPLGEAKETRLGRAITPLTQSNPGISGIYPLASPRDAFAARALLAQAAQQTLDVQYYIWRGDTTGTLLLQALLEAADRGVRVRLLLDDNGTSGIDPQIAALDSHPKVEVRLFNPFPSRSAKWLGFLTDFSRANRRMHNKSFTADNMASIVGGRNIGDEYFAATDGVLFADLDVLSVGPVVRQVSDDFDRYWGSGSAYPVNRLMPAASVSERAEVAATANRLRQSPKATEYVAALKKLQFINQLLHGQLELIWANTRMVSDDPAKGLGKVAPEQLLTYQVGAIIARPNSHVELVSPYFVPTPAGVEAFSEMSRRGVKVRILTNALESTDVVAVHAGYAKARKDLLQAGIELYEMRRQSAVSDKADKHKVFGSSGSSLHAKTFAVDGQRVFVGSFNFDPRSAKLNTELGFVIDSPLLAKRIELAFDQDLPLSAYRVMLAENGDLKWVEQSASGHISYDTEPGSSIWVRMAVGFLSLLPIDWML